MITLFTTKTCKYCPEIKEMLAKNHILFSEMNCSDPDIAKILRNYGGSGVPAIVTDDMELITGSDAIKEYVRNKKD